MSALVNGSSGQICAGCRVWWSARTAGMREEAGDATPGGVQRLMSTPAKAGAGSTSGMPGWLTTVSGTTLWVIRVTPMANWQWTELPALVKTRAGSQDRSHAGQSVAVAPRRGGMAGTGRGAFDYLLSGCGWGPVRSRAAAHRRPTLGSRRRLREHLRGGDLERSCHRVGRVDSLRQLMRGYWVGDGRSGYGGTAAPAWPGLPDRSEKLGKDVAPVGCHPTGVPAAAMTRQGRRARGSHRPWCCAVTLAAAQRHLRGFRSRDVNGSRRRRR